MSKIITLIFIVTFMNISAIRFPTSCLSCLDCTDYGPLSDDGFDGLLNGRDRYKSRSLGVDLPCPRAPLADNIAVVVMILRSGK